MATLVAEPPKALPSAVIAADWFAASVTAADGKRPTSTLLWSEGPHVLMMPHLTGSGSDLKDGPVPDHDRATAGAWPGAENRLVADLNRFLQGRHALDIVRRNWT